MSISKEEWKLEQKRVNHVVELAKKRIGGLGGYIAEVQSDIVDIRKHFWDDVTVNLDDATEAAETAASMKQQSELLAERERSFRHVNTEIERLRRIEDSPYFGRVDFREEGESETESIYLGIASMMDEKGEDFLIYDWRAPISSLYYDHSPGHVSFQAPESEIKGEMTTKRQYVIRRGKILSLFDTGLTIGDELLQEVLGRQADAQMRSIVATIQKEQNRLIRDEKSQLLIVRGAAGSGKTSAALQRIAYLLYRYRDQLQANQIILFSPNPIFNSYVSSVLPELGEENMQQATFQQYLDRHLGKDYQVEDPFQQVEYTLTAQQDVDYQIRIDGVHFKSTEEFLQIIDDYLVHLGKKGLWFQDICYRGEPMVTKEEIKRQFLSYDTTRSIPLRMDLLKEWLLERLSIKAKQEEKADWVEEAIELLPDEVYQQIQQRVQRKERFSEETFDDFERQRKMLKEYVVKKQFKKLYQSVRRLHFIDFRQTYLNIWQQDGQTDSRLPHDWSRIGMQTARMFTKKRIPYEDATPFLYFKGQIEGFPKDLSIRHLFIDEAQDYTPFQFLFLKRMFPRSKMTILGDLNQSIFAHASDGFQSIGTLFPEQRTAEIVLHRTYRSTEPIVTFTRQFIPDGKSIQPFARDGALPRLVHVRQPQAWIKAIVKSAKERLEQGFKTVAIICKTAAEADEVYQKLHPLLEVHLIRKESSNFETGVLIIPSYLAKGVEFDAVIIYDASLSVYNKESERKLFYTACTRAMHDLELFYMDELSPFVQEVDSKSYQQVEFD
ncbi:DNA helicase-2 / ATP-dependent DNA helicase PcrA [Seinonella peptonophila]|uniref:DNA helicase-2 / ATP-dependent DNA helicase PcrA n=1 Tax=Seinonella peptonophila TaxID=112248 RepID=A0A1M4XAN9_9BACL|nr:RNA polymerase recycling motor HelD [Seinonella peptonophila]SHE90480.1 DNA helicase-2 / ATP-dependent DNA helicase PcrA [Seinonella peptonophila]